jgi:basic membrane lipoprotein Med (substrate-binding protein (PBP1-ABC) superfamily)
MSNSTTSKTNQAWEHKDQAKEAAGSALDKAKDAVSHAGQAVGSGVSAAATAVGQKAEQATASVGHGMQNLADTVRDKAPDSGMLGSAAKTVASGLESGGKYLEEKNLSGMADDLSGLISRNPIPALLIGIGIGFLLGRR